MKSLLIRSKLYPTHSEVIFLNPHLMATLEDPNILKTTPRITIMRTIAIDINIHENNEAIYSHYIFIIKLNNNILINIISLFSEITLLAYWLVT
jgi:hypothetical protein